MDNKSYNSKFTEYDLEESFIALFKKQGYEYEYGEDMHRKFDDILLLDDLRSYLVDRYASARLTNVETEKIINKISLISYEPLYIGNRDTFWLINEGFDLIREDAGKNPIHIDYINFDEPQKNRFKIINQYSVDGKKRRRPDILVFINGIPIAIFEFKTAVEETKTIKDAWKQVNIRYCRDIPNLMKYCFLSVISDGANTKMGTIFTPFPFYYAWKKEEEQDEEAKGIGSLLTMVKGAFAKDRLVAILRDFIFYPDNSQKEEAIVCRYPQFFAANKMFDNIKLHLKPNGDGKGGTYFGATGCGKTYAMLFLSRMIAHRDNDTFKNPTILVLADREDLDTQTSELFVSAKRFLGEQDVRSIENRVDLKNTLGDKQSGGVYITTIQKFCEDTGLLSDRANIICISDEAHRTQIGVNAKLVKTEEGVYTTYGFASYLRTSFPNATYCGFTGTPIDETIKVFGPIVDTYTMKESSDDGITVRISYEPRIARVKLSDEVLAEITKYYNKAIEEGTNLKAVNESKKAMSHISEILEHPDRIKLLASDIVEHYEKLCAEKPGVVQKAMIVCSSRPGALKLLKAILNIRPKWGEKKEAEETESLSQDELNKLVALPKINMVATSDKNDEEELSKICGSKEYRQMLDKQFKNDDSNFKIAIVVDMWITGFDIPSLAVMYIDKPLQKHTLVQTISRVNRVYEGKEKGLVVDYIGIKDEMEEAIKQYGDPQQNPVDDLEETIKVFRTYLSQVDDMFASFDASKFYTGEALERLICLNEAVEFVQKIPTQEAQFKGMVYRLKCAYSICAPSGELGDEEILRAQFYMAVRSIILKQEGGDIEISAIERMNIDVEKMVQEAMNFSNVEKVLLTGETIDIFSDEFMEELNKIKLPLSKFQVLLQLIRKAISKYSRLNKIKAIEFDKRLKAVAERYNKMGADESSESHDGYSVTGLTEELLKILEDLQHEEEKNQVLGITYDERAYYDIIVKVRDEKDFAYDNDKCISLAKKIKGLIDEKSQYADWYSRDDIRGQLNMEMSKLFHSSKYYKEKTDIAWYDDLFNMIMEQAIDIIRFAA